MLPVRDIQSAIVDQLAQHRRLVLTAPTGSGKSTQLPQMLAEAGVIDGRIIVLQPRRLAARMVARRVAAEMGSHVGQIVGYQTRHDSQISAQSRIVFMTEGLFLNLVQRQPSLQGVGAVVLDEFHERSLAADMALASVVRLQRNARADLRLVVMSATLDADAVATYLDCPVLEAHGRAFPVDVSYLPRRSTQPIWTQAARAVRDVLERETTGDVLVFMPGAYEIRRTIEACRQSVGGGAGVTFLPLHGSLPADAQDAAVSASSGRKVVVATNVAQTSITIEGICHVIDSGLAKVHRYDARRGLNVLRLEPISQASADQRAGRAGRTAPGTCLRLWPAQEHRSRDAHDTPEVRRLDLAQALLQLKAMGAQDVEAFDWFEAPEPAAIERAMGELRSLGAVADDGKLTEVGSAMAKFPMHPRLSRMLLAAAERGCVHRATLWAALVSDRDIATGPAPDRLREPDDAGSASDLLILERQLEAAAASRFDPAACTKLGVHANACREVAQTRRLFVNLCRDAGLAMRGPQRTEDLLKCLLVAFADHLAVLGDMQHRRCSMAGQKRVVLDKNSAVQKAGLIVAMDMREVGRKDAVQTVLSLASEVQLDWLQEVHPDRLTTQTVTLWNEDKRAAEAVEQVTFDSLVLEQTARPASDMAAAADVLVEQIQRGNLKLSQWNEAVDQWIARARCVADWLPDRDLVRYDEEDIAVILHELVAGQSQFSKVDARPVLPAVRDVLSWDDQQLIEKIAPSELKLPSGRRMKIEYQPGQRPRGRAKIQDLYGLTETPRVAGGRQPILLEILGPNFRPVQVTDDLAGFWANLYPTLKKELSRRYPRHEWR